MAVPISFPNFHSMELASSSPVSIFATTSSLTSSVKTGDTTRPIFSHASLARCSLPFRACPSASLGFRSFGSGNKGVKWSRKRLLIRASSDVGAAGSDPPLSKFSDFTDAVWKFLRPHTIRGTILGSTSLVARALLENTTLINWCLLPKALSGLLALICGNGYIVGINQIYDVEIDRVNKPYLPIAAGNLTAFSAWVLVLSFAALGFLIVSLNFGPFVSSLYCLGLFLGTIYYVPPFSLAVESNKKAVYLNYIQVNGGNLGADEGDNTFGWTLSPAKIQCSSGFSYLNPQSPNPNVHVRAVVGGPDMQDHFPDQRTDYKHSSEPSTYINAPLVGAHAYLAHFFGQL